MKIEVQENTILSIVLFLWVLKLHFYSAIGTILVVTKMFLKENYIELRRKKVTEV